MTREQIDKLRRINLKREAGVMTDDEKRAVWLSIDDLLDLAERALLLEDVQAQIDAAYERGVADGLRKARS